MSMIDALTHIQEYFTVGLGVLLVVGVIGNILNCVVFLRKRLRYNSCSIFFATASVANGAVMTYYTIPRIHSVYNSPPENGNLVY
ncbi:unnamed protein product, partial [Rotaria sp. Silwood2]